MTWLPLLLSDSSAALRYLVLKDLLARDSTDEELLELQALSLEDPIVSSLLHNQREDGSWDHSESLGLHMDTIRNTAQAMYRLGYLGLGKEHSSIQKAANYMFSQQLDDGAWPRGENGKLTFDHPQHGPVITPMQTAFPLRALAMCGYATDARVEKVYELLITYRAEDGSWPTYLSPDGKTSYQVVGYRQLPNSRFGCRTNSTSALTAFAYHPKRKNSDVAERVLDLLLARETRDRQFLGFEVARMVGIEPAHGYLTYYGRYDLSLILKLCWQIGATMEDPQVADLVKYLREIQGSYGLWEYLPNPQATRWVTYDLLQSLSRLDGTSEWFSTEPRTKYRSYPRKPKRY